MSRRVSHSDRGGGRGFRRGSGRDFGQSFSRGGFRGASRDNTTHNLNRSDGLITSTASQPGLAASAAFYRPKPRLGRGAFSSRQVFNHFNPSFVGYDPRLTSTINGCEKKPDDASFALVYASNQPHWMTKNTLYIKSRLHLLPEYADKKALLVAQHKEPTQKELMDRVAAKLTESIQFGRYGIEDGPEVECFDEDGQIVSLVVPGDWMPEDHELPMFASVDTPSIKYRPAEHEPIAVYAGYGDVPHLTGFKFTAWFLIEEIELFAANSSDLAGSMHDMKWSGDLNREWAAIKLQRIEKGEPDWRPSPDIRGLKYKAKKGSQDKKSEDQENAVGSVTTSADYEEVDKSETIAVVGEKDDKAGVTQRVTSAQEVQEVDATEEEVDATEEVKKKIESALFMKVDVSDTDSGEIGAAEEAQKTVHTLDTVKVGAMGLDAVEVGVVEISAVEAVAVEAVALEVVAVEVVAAEFDAKEVATIEADMTKGVNGVEVEEVQPEDAKEKDIPKVEANEVESKDGVTKDGSADDGEIREIKEEEMRVEETKVEVPKVEELKVEEPKVEEEIKGEEMKEEK